MNWLYLIKENKANTSKGAWHLFVCLVFCIANNAFSEDAEVKLNSNDGSTKMIVQDKDAVAVFSADSDGNTVIKGTATIVGPGFSVGGSTLVVKGGNVGIGMGNPAAALDVNGSAQFGAGVAKSTFTAVGALNLADNQNITLSGTGKVTGLAAPTAASDAANKQYVDNKFPASPAQGDILYHNGTSWVRLPAGTAGQVLKSGGTGAPPYWGNAESFCTVNGDKNTHTILNGDVVYCDNNLRMWTPTADIGGSAAIKTWGPSQHEPSNSCVGLGASYPACNYCDSLTYAGHDDWVLPSCASGGAQGTGCQLYAFGMDACGWTASGTQASCTPSWDTNAQSYKYWSSSELVSPNTDRAWIVDFSYGGVDNYNKTINSFYTRCVRAGP